MTETKVLKGQISFDEISKQRKNRNEREQRRLIKKIKIDLETTYTQLVFAVDEAKSERDAGQAGGAALENLIKALSATKTALELVEKSEE